MNINHQLQQVRDWFESLTEDERGQFKQSNHMDSFLKVAEAQGWSAVNTLLVLRWGLDRKQCQLADQLLTFALSIPDISDAERQEVADALKENAQMGASD